MRHSSKNPSPSAARAITRAKAAAALRNSRDLAKTARLIGLELLAQCNRATGWCSISAAALAEAIGCHERTARRGLAQLAAVGFIVIEKGRHHEPDAFLLLVDRLAALAEGLAAQVQTVCSAAARAAKAARAHATAKGQGMLAAAREARRAAVEAAKAARDRLRERSPAPPTPVSKTAENTFQGQRSDRAFCPRIPSRNIIPKDGFRNLASKAGFWRAPGTREGQALTDQQLDARAHSRLYTALQGLGQATMAAFLSHPDATRLEAAAIKAERFQPDYGRTGLAVIAAHLNVVRS